MAAGAIVLAASVVDPVPGDEGIGVVIIGNGIKMFNGNNAFILGKDKENIKWGLSIDENINNLKINGMPPTEIIKTKLDDDDVYFWYYEGLDVDHSNISEVKITS